MWDADELAEHLQDASGVHHAIDASDSCVIATRRIGSHENGITFRTYAENGWRVGFYDRDDTGDRVGFVPMEDLD